MTRKISLNKGKFTLVDFKDFEYLNRWKWKISNKGYAVRSKKINGKHKEIRMHCVIINTPRDLQTDHINRNKLDNRRKNLRIVNATQNMINRNMLKNNTSGIRGVCWNKTRNKWLAQIQYNYKNIFLGQFRSLQVAKLARKWGERLYFGNLTEPIIDGDSDNWVLYR